jgi:hypothetical protein
VASASAARPPMAPRGPPPGSVPVPPPVPAGWGSDAWRPPVAQLRPPQPIAEEPAAGVAQVIPYGDLLELCLPRINAPELLASRFPAVDPCQLLAGSGSRSRVQRSLNVDQARVTLLNAHFTKPVVSGKIASSSSRFHMAEACHSRLFVAPQIDQPLLNLLPTSSGLSRSGSEQHLKVLGGLFEGAMATFRLAFHGTVLTRALFQSHAVPSQEQTSIMSHQMAAHLEALDTSAKSAASIVASMRGLLLQLTGLSGTAVSPGLMALPYSGGALFGPMLQRHVEELTQLGQQATQLRASSMGQSSRPATGFSGPPAKRHKPQASHAPARPPAPASFRAKGKGGSRGRGAPRGGARGGKR